MDEEPENEGAGREASWIDRHLPGILVAGAVICILGLIGRALTG